MQHLRCAAMIPLEARFRPAQINLVKPWFQLHGYRYTESMIQNSCMHWDNIRNETLSFQRTRLLIPVPIHACRQLSKDLKLEGNGSGSKGNHTNKNNGGSSSKKDGKSKKEPKGKSKTTQKGKPTKKPKTSRKTRSKGSETAQEAGNPEATSHSSKRSRKGAWAHGGIVASSFTLAWIYMHFLSHHIYRLFFLLEAFIDLRWLDYKTKCSTFSGNGMPWGKPHGPVRCNIHWKALGLKGLEMNVYNSCMWIYPRHAFQSPLKPSINQDALRTTKGCTLILGSGWGVKNIWKFRTWWNHPFERMMYITTLFIHEHVPTLHLLTWIHLPARFCQVPHTRPGGWLGNMDVEKLDPISNAWLQIQIDHHIYDVYSLSIFDACWDFMYNFSACCESPWHRNAKSWWWTMYIHAVIHFSLHTSNKPLQGKMPRPHRICCCWHERCCGRDAGSTMPGSCRSSKCSSKEVGHWDMHYS